MDRVFLLLLIPISYVNGGIKLPVRSRAQTEKFFHLCSASLERTVEMVAPQHSHGTRRTFKNNTFGSICHSHAVVDYYRKTVLGDLKPEIYFPAIDLVF